MIFTQIKIRFTTMLFSYFLLSFIFISCNNDETKRPNILFIMADDHASTAIGAYNQRLSEITVTPNIDRLADEGMMLNNCFATNSICTPSRATILTGQYSHINNVKTLKDSLDPKHPNVAKHLKKAGYQTAVFGKWHLKAQPAGFDDWSVLPLQGLYFDPVFRVKDKGEMVIKGHSSDVIADLTLDWLVNRDKDKPFFLNMHFKAPHFDYQNAPRFDSLFVNVELPEPDNLLDDYSNRSEAARISDLPLDLDYDRHEKGPKNISKENKRKIRYQNYVKNYLRCVAGIDQNVGRVMDYLDTEGLAENTIVIYTSDQGLFLGEHGLCDKRFFYEESIKMPFIIRYPAEIKAASSNDDMILNTDFAPTLIEFAGLPPAAEMQGRSFRSNLLGNTAADWRKSMYYRYWFHMANLNVPAHYGIRTDRYKLIYYYGLPLDAKGAKDTTFTAQWELFDLQKDPHEMNNVYNNPGYAKIVKFLKMELKNLKAELSDEDSQYPEMVELNIKGWK